MLCQAYFAHFFPCSNSILNLVFNKKRGSESCYHFNFQSSPYVYPLPYLPTSLGHLCSDLLVDSLWLYYSLRSQLCAASVHLTSILTNLITSGKLHSTDSGSNERGNWHSGASVRQWGWHQCFRQCMLRYLYRACVAWQNPLAFMLQGMISRTSVLHA